MMGRRSTRSLIRKVVECLIEGPKSTSEIEEKTNLDRTAIAKYLNILKEVNLLVEEQQGTSKVFAIVPTYRVDTFFGLPLTEKANKDVNSLYYLITKNWKDATNRKLLKTHAQKIAYNVINKFNLDIPSGWYIYGGICVASYDESKDYSYNKFPKEVEDYVRKIVVEYASIEPAWEIKKKQYDETGNELYKVKEEILSILYSSDFDKHPKNSLFILVKKLRRLIQLCPKNIVGEHMEVLGSYQDLMLDLSSKMDESFIIEHKRVILILFEEIWKLIALFNFKNDLQQYYPQKILEIHFSLDINQQEDEIIAIGTELQSTVPEEETADLLRKKLQEALMKIESLNVEEQKKHKDKSAKRAKEIGHEKYQDELLEQVGLK